MSHPKNPDGGLGFCPQGRRCLGEVATDAASGPEKWGQTGCHICLPLSPMLTSPLPSAFEPFGQRVLAANGETTLKLLARRAKKALR